ncbi:HEAT repeat domain-containing protein [Paenibacillus soyae]|uniref:HEAT repeat domain-containing protein n=1 Tax=Paenibacillus soyae TaxID=2969249 RepID=A0A9X2S8N8_9BACL|nr:HEAT repeat domain-containing protein [Paenibacillus soyae]MCR2804276.1 HEAT repeat domain-containing protein [Paenibacillus soyae]
MSQDLNGMGRFHLQNDSYGIAAFYFHRAIRQQPSTGSAWNGLVLSLGLMRREADTQTVLARFALSPQLPFDKQLVPSAFMMYRNHPQAMAAWARAMAGRSNVSAEERQGFTAMAEDIDEQYGKLVAERGEEALKREGMMTLEELAARVTELDLIMQGQADALVARAEQWLKDESTALTAIRMLSLLPEPRSERLLRRTCRDESLPGKMRTHALLALRWMGVREKVRLHKLGESFVVDLSDPKPELTISVPSAYKPALDRMHLWIAKEQGMVTHEEYESFASTEELELPQPLAEKVKAADLPGHLQEVVHTVIRSAYDEYYPVVPFIREYRSWGNAFLIIMKEYVEGNGMKWTYGELEQDDTAALHRNWLLSAVSDFQQ